MLSQVILFQVRHESSQSHDQVKQKFLRTTADTDKKAINKTTTKQGQDKSQLYSVGLEYIKVYIDDETNLRVVLRHTISPSRYSIDIIAFTIYTGQQAQYERADESPPIQKESKKVQKKIMIDIDNM